MFRVDNPHTKPFAFWEWMIASVRETDPDVIFLAEAFTRPRVMERLAKLGFTQSYTYFTWRNEKWELTEYFAELSDPAAPRLLPAQRLAQHPRHPPHVVAAGHPGDVHHALPARRRAQCELRDLRTGVRVAGAHHRETGSEEYLDSEKYEVRHWDLERPDSLRHLIGRVNSIRRAHAALDATTRCGSRASRTT